MTIKMIELVNMYLLMQEFSKRVVPVQVMYWLTINAKRMKPSYDFYAQSKNKLSLDILYKNDDGSMITQQSDGTFKYNVPDGKESEWDERCNDINNLDATFDPYILDLEKVVKNNPAWNIEPMFMMGLIELLKTSECD